LLILIYINELPYCIYHTGKLLIYTDNSSVLITAENIKVLQIKAKTMLDYMSEWFLVNG